jgi:hypothetical protein
MAASTIENIYNDYRTASEYPADYTFDFFSKNAIQFNNITTLKNESELKLYIELIWQQLNALYQKDRLNKAADIAIKHLKIIDNEIDRLNLLSIKDDWYYGILLFKGMAFYRLRDYKTSTPIFKQLVAHDSKNDNYKIWLSYSLYGERMWISKTVTVVCAVMILIEIFFKKLIPSYSVRMWLDGIAIFGLVATMIYDYYIKRNFRKRKIG